MSPHAPPPDRTAFVVIGSHRSGTSAMARVLELAGLGTMPADLVPPHPVDNPDGYWESRSIIEMNDAVLAEARGTWDRPPDIRTIRTCHVDRAADLLAHQYGRAASIVLKDPRISLLVPLWDAALARLGIRPTYVVMVRHPTEVAASLSARGDLSVGEAASLCMAYLLAAEAGTRGLRRAFVDYDRLLTDWRSALITFAGTDLESDAAARAVASFLSPGRRRQRRTDLPALADGGRAQSVYDLLVDGVDAEVLRDRLDALVGARSPPAVGRERSATGPEGPGWLLVTGAPRGGTSLLRAILAEHPRIALLQEYGLTDLVRRIDAIVDRAPPASADWDSPGDPTDERFNAASRFYRERPDRAAVTRGGGDPGPAQFSAVAMGLFKGLFPGKDPEIIGDKMPITSTWEDLPFLFDRLPGFRVVGVIRNPSDAVRSSLVRRAATRRGRDSWPIRTVEEAVAQWVTAWRALRAMRARFKTAVKIVKYEDLCGRPQDVSDEVYTWLGLAPHRIATPIAALPPDLALHTADEQAVVERSLGAIITAWPNADAEVLMSDHDVPPPPYIFGDRIHLAQAEAAAHLESGFSFPEEWGRWTEGLRAVVSIYHGLARGLLLVEIGVQQAFARAGETCDVVVRSGWGEPKLFQLPPERSRLAFLAQAEEADDRGRLRFELLIVRPKSVDEPPPDSRALGILVETITVSRLANADPDRAGPREPPR